MTLVRVPTPIGTLTIIASQAGLKRVLWEGEEPPAGAGPAAEGCSAGAISHQAAIAITEYFAGSRRAFDIPLDLGGTAFQQSAWLKLAGIPFGSTISYAEQARRIGRPGAARAVGSADSRNPVPIVLPCHRVIGSSGALTGFGGGLQVKRALLEHESRVLGRLA